MTILPSPNRVTPLPDLDQMPMFAEILDHPKYGLACQRMADRLNLPRPERVDSIDVSVGLLWFFSIIEGDK